MNESEYGWKNLKKTKKIVKQIHSLYLATDTLAGIKKIDTEKALGKLRQQMKKNGYPLVEVDTAHSSYTFYTTITCLRLSIYIPTGR